MTIDLNDPGQAPAAEPIRGVAFAKPSDNSVFVEVKKPLKPARVFLHFFLASMGIIWMIPLVISLYSSFRPFLKTQTDGFLSVGGGFSLDNYRTALSEGDFIDKYWNTALILIPALVLTILLASMIAFAASRFTWKFNIFFLVLFTAGNLLPQQIMVAPLFQAFRRIPLPSGVNNAFFIVPVLVVLAALLYYSFQASDTTTGGWLRSPLVLGVGATALFLAMIWWQSPSGGISNSGKLNGSNWAIILLHVGFQMGFCTFVLSNYMKLLPKELNEAAMVDGASFWTQYWQIIMPLTRPALAALATLEFAWIYNDFFWAVIFEQRGDDRPITSALSNLGGEFTTDTNVVSAASIFVILPVLAVYFALQKHFIAGLTLGANKG